MGERVWLGHHRLKTVLGLGEVVGRILAGLVVLLIPFGVRSAFADPSGPPHEHAYGQPFLSRIYLVSTPGEN
jgi:hypothetical protein